MRPQVAVEWWARLRASLQALASPPGRLTRDWLDGKRVGYLPPVALFLYVNIAFFLIQSASGVSILSWPLDVHLRNDILGLAQPLFRATAGAGAASNAKYVAVFNALEVVHAKALVIVMIPLFAVPLMLLPAVRRTRFTGAIAFSAHYYTYALIMLSALFPLLSLALQGLAYAGIQNTEHGLDPTIDHIVSVVQAGLLGWYLARALQTLTKLPRWQRLLCSVALVTVSLGLLRLYHLLVFGTTLISV